MPTDPLGKVELESVMAEFLIECGEEFADVLAVWKDHRMQHFEQKTERRLVVTMLESESRTKEHPVVISVVVTGTADITRGYEGASQLGGFLAQKSRLETRVLPGGMTTGCWTMDRIENFAASDRCNALSLLGPEVMVSMSLSGFRRL